MKTQSIFYLFIFFLMGCTTKPTGDNNTLNKETSVKKDSTPRVTGIGGIFFKSQDSEKTKEWYSKNLGLNTDDFGSPFEFRNANNPEEVNYLNWDAFPDSTKMFAPSEKQFMINYRVQNIDGLVKNLKKNGVVILDELVTYEYGKFIHIMDLEGNKIELWEPVDSVLSKMGRVTNK